MFKKQSCNEIWIQENIFWTKGRIFMKFCTYVIWDLLYIFADNQHTYNKKIEKKCRWFLILKVEEKTNTDSNFEIIQREFLNELLLVVILKYYKNKLILRMKNRECFYKKQNFICIFRSLKKFQLNPQNSTIAVFRTINKLQSSFLKSTLCSQGKSSINVQDDLSTKCNITSTHFYSMKNWYQECFHTLK